MTVPWGSLHALPIKNADQPVADWQAMLPSLLKEIYVITADLRGTIRGELGIGYKRRNYLDLVMNPAQINLMRQIKRAFDPNNILKPNLRILIFVGIEEKIRRNIDALNHHLDLSSVIKKIEEFMEK